MSWAGTVRCYAADSPDTCPRSARLKSTRGTSVGQPFNRADGTSKSNIIDDGHVRTRYIICDHHPSLRPRLLASCPAAVSRYTNRGIISSLSSSHVQTLEFDAELRLTSSWSDFRISVYVRLSLLDRRARCPTCIGCINASTCPELWHPASRHFVPFRTQAFLTPEVSNSDHNPDP